MSMLAAAVGPNLTKLLHDQLDLIFTYEFNEYVRSSLAACAKSIPPLLRSIQGMLSMSEPFQAESFATQIAFWTNYLSY
jgi:hypothetical protein